MRWAGPSAPSSRPPAAPAIAASIGSAFITIPGPPPYGVSSTVRCRSAVKSRGLTVATVMTPASRARPTTPAASAGSISSGRIVTTVNLIRSPPVVRQAVRRIDRDDARREVDRLDELVDERQQPLELAIVDHQQILHPAVDRVDRAPRGAIDELDLTADEIVEQDVVVVQREGLAIDLDDLAAQRLGVVARGDALEQDEP